MNERMPTMETHISGAQSTSGHRFLLPKTHTRKRGIGTHEITTIAKQNLFMQSRPRPSRLPKAPQMTKMQRSILKIFHSMHIQNTRVFLTTPFYRTNDYLLWKTSFLMFPTRDKKCLCKSKSQRISLGNFASSVIWT